MFKLLSWLNNKEKIWDFKGGIHPPEMKSLSSHIPLRQLPLADVFILPLQQHVGPEGELLVEIGQKVAKGQPLTRGFGKTVPIHAPTSGCVTAIAPHVVAHPSGLKELCITLTADGQDSWGERHPIANYQYETPETLVRLIHEAGIAGLGGAGFPSAEKIHTSFNKVDTLIINAAECEPYITADDRLMQEYAAEIILGCEILQYILTPKRILIGIEDNKPEAITALKQALPPHNQIIQLRVIPTKYPSGGAKQLTKILTGMEVPHGQRSSAIGVLMQNVGTVYAIKRAIIDGEPLIERVVTLTGELMQKPGNVWARLGTPIKFLLQQGGFSLQEKTPMVIMGGPLMGFTLNSLDAPMVKITNCLITPSNSEFNQDEEELACIRCGQCTDACPAGLLPQQLYWFSLGQEHEKARKHNLFDCIECGACAYVCPSNIPLVQYYRQEKAEIRAIDNETRRANEAKARFEARTERLEREKLAREERHQRSKVTLTPDDRSTVAAALERVKARRSEQESHNTVVTALSEGTQDTRQAALSAAIERAKAKKAAQASDTTASDVDNNKAGDDTRKAAVAAAVARAKAKQAAQASDTTASAADNNKAGDDTRKAAVAAAVARAKAKQAAQASDTTASAADNNKAGDDTRKAAVAAAVARAKAKQAAQASDTTATAADNSKAGDDTRKAAVAAAVARAKAKQAAQASDTTATAADNSKAGDDTRKAAVAAAVARAKAKQAAAKQQQPATPEPVADDLSTASHEPDPQQARKAAIVAAIAKVKEKQNASTPRDEA